MEQKYCRLKELCEPRILRSLKQTIMNAWEYVHEYIGVSEPEGIKLYEKLMDLISFHCDGKYLYTYV